MPASPENKAPGESPPDAPVQPAANAQVQPPANGQTTGALERLGQLGWQALPAIGGAIGFAGFVAIIGAAIEWVRFDAAHLPATQAVLAVPKQELVIIGALALGAFTVGALIAVVVVYVINSQGDATVSTVSGLIAVAVAEMGVTVAFINVGDAWTYVLLIMWFGVIGLVTAAVAGVVMRHFKPGAEAKPAAQKASRAQGVLVALLLAAGIVAGTVFVVKDDAIRWVLIMLAVVALLATMNLLVATATAKFAWYGVSVFFSVLLFGAALTFARTMREPKVQPIALIRKSDDVGICGVYITQTNERVYVGRLSLQGHRPGLIFWVPTSDIDVVSVGQLERTDATFGKLAVAMLAQLYKDRSEQAAPALKNASVTEVEGVASATGKQTTTVRETAPANARPTRYPEESVPASCTSPPPTPRAAAAAPGA
jgi:hypothetical protein